MNPFAPIIFVAICAYVLYDQLSFHAIMNRARKLTAQGKYDDAINGLHAGLQRVFITIPAPQSQIYYAIGMCYVDQKAYDKAIKYFQHVTAQPSARMYRTQAPERLKECQEALAALKPSPATYSFTDNRETPEKCFANGNTHLVEWRYDDACLLYERGLRIANDPRSITSLRIVARLSIANLAAGRPDKAIYWAEHDVHNDIDPTLSLSTYAIAAAAYINQGQLDLAQSYCRKGFLLATELVNEPEVMHYMGIQAHILFERGKLNEAIKIAQEAVSLGELHFQARKSYIVHARALMAKGNYDEGLSVLERAEQTQRVQSEHTNTKLDGSLAIVKARTYLAIKEPDKAMDIIATWLPRLHLCPASSSTLKLMEAQVYSSRGAGTEALSILNAQRDFIQTKMPANRTTNLAVHAVAGRIHFDLGDYLTAHKYLALYVASSPNPIQLPLGFHQLGECCEKLGDVDAANSAYRNGVSVGIETLAATKCRLRLANLSNGGN